MNHREVWFVRRQARGRPIVVRGFRDSDRWQDTTNNIKIEQHDVSFWQYIVVPKPPKSEGPFYVGPTFGRWCILHENECGYQGDKYPLLNFDLKTAQKACDYLNYLWAKYKP